MVISHCTRRRDSSVGSVVRDTHVVVELRLLIHIIDQKYFPRIMECLFGYLGGRKVKISFLLLKINCVCVAKHHFDALYLRK